MSSISRSKNVNKNKSRRRRCPKGTRRNVEGKCETASIHLLGNSKLFQLSFNKSKIRNYELVSAVESSASSFLNTSVLLGLIDIDEAKKSVKGISKRNINFKNAMHNFEKDFELPEGSLDKEVVSKDQDIKQRLTEVLNEFLKVGYATVLSFFIENNMNFPVSNIREEYIVAYKNRTKSGEHIMYFDPQSKRVLNNIEDLYGIETLGENYKPRRKIPAHVKPYLNTLKKIDIRYVVYFTHVNYTQQNTVKMKSKNNFLKYETPSPVTQYAIDNFTQPIKVLGGHSLVQVSFTPKQFDEYKNFNVRENFTLSGGSCAVHALFSLGLRDVIQAKKDGEIMDMKSYSKLQEGVYTTNITKYLTKVLKLPKNTLKYNSIHFKDELKHVNEPEEEMTKILNSQLENNHATILCLFYADLTDAKKSDLWDKTYKYKQTGVTNDSIIPRFYHITRVFSRNNNGHAIVAYKRNNKIEYFDPQTLDRNADRTSVNEIMKPYSDPLLLNSFITFHFTDYKDQDDIILDDTDTSCHLVLGDSPSQSNNSSKSSHSSNNRSS